MHEVPLVAASFDAGCRAAPPLCAEPPPGCRHFSSTMATAGVDILIGVGQWLYTNVKKAHTKYMQYKNRHKKGEIMEAYEDTCSEVIRDLMSTPDYTIQAWVVCKQKLLELQSEAQREHYYWATEFRDMTGMMPVKPPKKSRKPKEKRYDPPDGFSIVGERDLYTKFQFEQFYDDPEYAWADAFPERRMLSEDEHGHMEDFEYYYGNNWQQVWDQAMPVQNLNLDRLNARHQFRGGGHRRVSRY